MSFKDNWSNWYWFVLKLFNVVWALLYTFLPLLSCIFYVNISDFTFIHIELNTVLKQFFKLTLSITLRCRRGLIFKHKKMLIIKIKKSRGDVMAVVYIQADRHIFLQMCILLQVRTIMPNMQILTSCLVFITFYFRVIILMYTS